jgi:signal transduction histidine kinase
MRFRSALVLGHAATFVLSAAVAALAIVSLSATVGATRRDASVFGQDLAAVERLRVRGEQLMSAGRGFLLTGEADDLARFEAARKDFAAQLATLRQRAVAGDEVAAVGDAATAYQVAAETVAAEREGAASADEAVIAKYDDAVKPRHEALEDALVKLLARADRSFDHSLDATAASARLSEVGVGAIAAAILAIGAALAWLTTRRLSADYLRLEQARQAATTAVRARDDTLAIVSHDLRTPLQTIVLGTGLLADEARDDDVRRRVRVFGNAAQRMRRMVDSLLEAAKLESGDVELRREACPISTVVDLTVEQFETRATSSDIRLDTRACGGALVLDRDRIVEVLSNLVDNAMKHTPAGGRVSVVADDSGETVRFAVRDSGSGVAEADLPHLFDRYWQRDRRRGNGVGLGLYICKMIVEAHGGHIGAGRAPDGGAELWFALPRASDTGS